MSSRGWFCWMNWLAEKSDPFRTSVPDDVHNPPEVGPRRLHRSHKMGSSSQVDSDEKGPSQHVAEFAQSYEQDPWQGTKLRKAKSENG